MTKGLVPSLLAIGVLRFCDQQKPGEHVELHTKIMALAGSVTGSVPSFPRICLKPLRFESFDHAISRMACLVGRALAPFQCGILFNNMIEHFQAIESLHVHDMNLEQGYVQFHLSSEKFEPSVVECCPTGTEAKTKRGPTAYSAVCFAQRFRKIKRSRDQRRV